MRVVPQIRLHITYICFDIHNNSPISALKRVVIIELLSSLPLEGKHVCRPANTVTHSIHLFSYTVTKRFAETDASMISISKYFIRHPRVKLYFKYVVGLYGRRIKYILSDKIN